MHQCISSALRWKFTSWIVKSEKQFYEKPFKNFIFIYKSSYRILSLNTFINSECSPKTLSENNGNSPKCYPNKKSKVKRLEIRHKKETKEHRKRRGQHQKKNKEAYYILETYNKKKKNSHKQNHLTLNPPAVPALMIRSGCNAWIDAYVTRDAETVPTLSTPGK